MRKPDRWHAQHALDLKPGEWWACQHPERPHDEDLTFYDNACRGCLLATKTAILSGRVVAPMVSLDDDGRVCENISPDEYLETVWPTYMGWLTA